MLNGFRGKAFLPDGVSSIKDGDSYVRRCSLCYALMLESSRGPASRILLIVSPALYNILPIKPVYGQYPY